MPHPIGVLVLVTLIGSLAAQWFHERLRRLEQPWLAGGDDVTNW